MLISEYHSSYRQVRSGELQKGRGTGLGLCLSLHIINLHKGIVEVTSQPGKGSIFSFLLPQRQDMKAPEIVYEIPVTPTATIHTVAVVDDQKSNLNLTTMCLRRLHLEVSLENVFECSVLSSVVVWTSFSPSLWNILMI